MRPTANKRWRWWTGQQAASQRATRYPIPAPGLENRSSWRGVGLQAELLLTATACEQVMSFARTPSALRPLTIRPKAWTLVGSMLRRPKPATVRDLPARMVEPRLEAPVRSAG